MDPLRDLAARLDEAGDTLTDLARRVPATDPAHPAFGADAPGRLGEVGRALHRQWTAATDERSREAGTAAARLSSAAGAVRDAAQRYTETDAAVAESVRDAPARHTGSEPPSRYAGSETPSRYADLESARYTPPDPVRPRGW